MAGTDDAIEMGRPGRAGAGRLRPCGSAGMRAGSAEPVRAAGLALTFEGESFAIRVTCERGDTLLSLGPFDDEEVVAIWRALAATSGLPLLVAGPDGVLQQPYRQLGRLLLGDRVDRRRLCVLSGRRPRFLVKRKPGRMPRRPLVYREPELAPGRLDRSAGLAGRDRAQSAPAGSA